MEQRKWYFYFPSIFVGALSQGRAFFVACLGIHFAVTVTLKYLQEKESNKSSADLACFFYTQHPLSAFTSIFPLSLCLFFPSCIFLLSCAAAQSRWKVNLQLTISIPRKGLHYFFVYLSLQSHIFHQTTIIGLEHQLPLPVLREEEQEEEDQGKKVRFETYYQHPVAQSYSINSPILSQ